MKRTFRTVIAVLTLVCAVMSFSSCSFFATMREYSKQASEIEIIPTPEDKEIYSSFASAVKNSEATALKIDESVSYSARDTEVSNEKGNADIFDKASSTLKTLIMQNNPGKTDREIAPASLTGTLLESFDSASSLSFSADRNMTAEAITDEEGEEVTDAEGNVIKEDVITDNFMNVSFNFFNDVVTEPASTNSDGETEEAVTEREYADEALIEEVFGEQADKDEILKNFEAVKDYIVVNDYSTEYSDCKVTSTVDLASNTVSSVNFEKTITVTAKVTGVGIFADYGEMTVSFKLIKNTDYSFTYAEAEE